MNRNTDAEYNRQMAEGRVGGIVDEYIVEERDTLQNIADRYGVSLEEIVEANRDMISNPSEMMKPGLRLMIPTKRREP
ncbi:MAG TPA: LysM domain-containing protein [Flavisolibacter sp.]|nr:LysM domain-containing protein [Flavisolibacter sp.]